FLVAHLVAARIEPHHISDLGTADAFTLKEFRPPENGMLFAEFDQASSKIEKPIIAARPIVPTDLVVLAISVVISILRPCKFVATQEHWHALREDKRRQKIATLFRSERIDLRIVGWSFRAAIPRLVVLIAVLIVFAVRIVVLLVITDEVVERETIVRRDDINARRRCAAVVQIQVRTPGEPIRDFT